MANLFPKRCKVYPRNNMQYISGILEKQKRIELPAELPLSEHELRRCLSFANCFEMVGGKHVLLTLDNFNKDNKDGKDVTATLPEGEVSKPRDEGADEDVEEEGPVTVASRVEERKVEPEQAAAQAQKPQNNQQKQNNQKADQKQQQK